MCRDIHRASPRKIVPIRLLAVLILLAAVGSPLATDAQENFRRRAVLSQAALRSLPEVGAVHTSKKLVALSDGSPIPILLALESCAGGWPEEVGEAALLRLRADSVAELIRCIRRERKGHRVSAIRVACILDPRHPELGSSLMSCFDDFNPTEMIEALIALEAVAACGEMDLQRFLDLPTRDNEILEALSARVLSAAASQQAAVHFLGVLDDASRAGDRRLVRAVRSLGPGMAPLAPRLLRVLMDVPVDDPRVGMLCDTIGAGGRVALHSLLRMLNDPNCPALSRGRAAFVLAHMKPGVRRSALVSLFEAMEDPRSAVRSGVVSLISAMSMREKTKLLRESEFLEGKGRLSLVRGLQSGTEHPSEMLPFLRGVLSADDEELCFESIRLLLHLHRTDWGRDDDEGLRSLVLSLAKKSKASPRVQAQALMALQEVFGYSSGIRARAIELLVSGQLAPEVVVELWKLLAKLQSHGREVQTLILNAIKEGPPMVACAAVSVLSDADGSRRDVRAILRVALRSKWWQVKYTALNVVLECCKSVGDLDDELVDLLDDRSQQVRDGARIVLDTLPE